MHTLKIGVSGIRGIVGQSLTADVVLDFAQAFGTYLDGGKVVIGEDPRPSSNALKLALSTGLTLTGCQVIDLDICPTPTVELMVKELKAQGGVVVTASHNPAQWNGLKFMGEEGIFLNEREMERLKVLYYNRNFKKLKLENLGNIETNKKAIRIHLDKVLSHIDSQAIKGKKFKVVLDSCNGAGSVITPGLLKNLGCTVIPINTDIKSPFPHPPEPVPENLKSLCARVLENKADIGFAQDPDADRLSIVSEEGIAIGEEYTLALATDHILSKAKKSKGQKVKIVTNLSTSRMIDDIAGKYKAQVIRTKVGEINVVEKMMEIGAEIGGEGNGGVIYPPIIYGRDSLAGMGLILEYMAKSGRTISELVKTIPKYHMLKRKVECPTMEQAKTVVETLKNKYKEERLDLTDGIKIIYPDSWVHVRPSNTEPIIRIMTEAKSQKEAEELCSKIIDEIHFEACD